MNMDDTIIYLNPMTHEVIKPDQIEEIDGILNLFYANDLQEITRWQKEYYDQNAEIYDDVSHLSFEIQNVKEADVREDFIKWLNVSPEHCVLDLSCGTGSDSINVARLLTTGTLVCADLSVEMLKQCKKKLDHFDADIRYCIANAEHLPFKDNTFDRLISFGGLNVFGNIKQSLAEIARVVKPGGKVLVGDESMPPWLYDTEFAKILIDNNPLFKFEIPLQDIPLEARNVVLRWIIGGVYYMIEFDIADGAPTGNFDLLIPGQRGGSLNTRYFGKLEGVRKDIKDKVYQAAKAENKSIHDWLNENLLSILETK